MEVTFGQAVGQMYDGTCVYAILIDALGEKDPMGSCRFFTSEEEAETVGRTMWNGLTETDKERSRVLLYTCRLKDLYHLGPYPALGTLLKTWRL